MVAQQVGKIEFFAVGVMTVELGRDNHEQRQHGGKHNLQRNCAVEGQA